MNLHIMSLSDAVVFEPDRPTYAIRIYSSDIRDRFELVDSNLFLAKPIYVFDDNPGLQRSKPGSITSDIADAIVGDFAQFKDRVEALLVHCIQGRNRSPAVAMALNDVFSLGADSNELKARFEELNWDVYRAVLAAGARFRA